MKITALEIENFKRLRAVSINPEGSTVVIAGANAQGKSSVLDAIWAALAGKKGAVEQPVREGEAGASVTLTLGELVVTKTWRPDGKSTLTVQSKAGANFPSPQSVLDTMLGEFSFDPLAFANAKPRDQRDALLGLIGLDLDELDRRRDGFYADRTIVNRETKRLEGALASLPEVPAFTPNEEVDVSALLEEILTYQRALDDVGRLRAEWQRNEAEIKRLTARNEAIATEASGPQDVVSTALRNQRTAEDLQAHIDGARDVNRAVRTKAERGELLTKILDTKVAAADLTAEMERVDKLKQQAIADAGLPVEGLGFDEDGVTLNGVPFTQASAAERLRTSVAIAMAANPEIRVIRITDGSLLDSKNLALIEEMAADKDFQIWVERVDESGAVGIVIEDGEVKA